MKVCFIHSDTPNLTGPAPLSLQLHPTAITPDLPIVRQGEFKVRVLLSWKSCGRRSKIRTQRGRCGTLSSPAPIMFNQLPPPKKKKTSLQQLSGIMFQPSIHRKWEKNTHNIDNLSQGYFFSCKSKQGEVR